MAGKMIVVEGFKAFRGTMRILSWVKDQEIYGEWLYRPDTECWYCDGSSYPADICDVLEVD